MKREKLEVPVKYAVNLYAILESVFDELSQCPSFTYVAKHLDNCVLPYETCLVGECEDKLEFDDLDLVSILTWHEYEKCYKYGYSIGHCFVTRLNGHFMDQFNGIQYVSGIDDGGYTRSDDMILTSTYTDLKKVVFTLVYDRIMYMIESLKPDNVNNQIAELIEKGDKELPNEKR